MDDDGFSSGAYWEARYRAGGTSGAGSYGRLAAFKVAFINSFVADNAVQSVLDLGSGDGNLLSLLRLPNYIGVDVSPTTLRRCAAQFAGESRRFMLPECAREQPPSDLTMSIDVIFHLVEDAVFEQHMMDLFNHATRFVLVYASNHDSAWPDRHVRHRRFSEHVARRWQDWRLLAHVPNRFPYDPGQPDETSFADFFVYGRTQEACVIHLPPG